jgi:hypothetical protein
LQPLEQKKNNKSSLCPPNDAQFKSLMNALPIMEQSLLLDQSHILELLSMHIPLEYEDGLSMSVDLKLGTLT